MKTKNKYCKNCGAELTDVKAKTCVNCGAKISKPVFKKWWFWVIVVLGLSVIGTAMGGDTEPGGTETDNDNGAAVTTAENKKDTSSSSVEYEVVEIQKMIDDLEENALKAEKTYKNKNVQVKGKIANFDSSGTYITIEAVNADEWNFDTVMCYIKNDDQLDFLMEKAVGDVVTVKGKIFSVGEILGYSININEIN